VREHAPETAVVMITAFGSEKIAVEAMKLGAADYIPKPFDNEPARAGGRARCSTAWRCGARSGSCRSRWRARIASEA